MPVTPIDVVVGDHSFRLTPLAARKGLEVSVVLFRNIGPALAGLLEKDDLRLLDVSLPSVGAALREICQRDLVQEIGYLWDVFLPQTAVIAPNGSSTMPLAQVADVLFPGAVQDMLALIWAHVQLNYRGFFDVAKSSLGSRLATVKG